MRTRRLAGLVLVLAGLLAGCGTDPVAAPSSSTKSTGGSSSSRSATVAPAAPRLIDHVHWTATAKGRQLQVFPTKAGRTDASATGVGRAWTEVLAAASNANTPGMYDQFRCHWEFARIAAPDKASWNLEPWRRAVGYVATVAASCNPGGSEG